LQEQVSVAANKVPFDISVALHRIRKAIFPFPKAAMFQLAEENYQSTFEQLIACLLSIRTRDEVSLPVAKKLFSVARSPKQIATLSIDDLDRLIQKTTFHYGKAKQIHEIAVRTLQEFGGILPNDEDVLLSLKGVGPKCANLVLGIAGKIQKISVDIHVHRVTNRWGILRTRTPEKTLEALNEIVPRKYWIEINELLVPFGKHICTLNLPKCSTCPVLDMCRQVGVHQHR
jgi:endonuclease-3